MFRNCGRKVCATFQGGGLVIEKDRKTIEKDRKTIEGNSER
jgi:hypothetical protein